MRRAALLLTLFLISLSLTACIGGISKTTYNVSGTAKDADGQPIQDVSIKATPGTKVATTDKAGKWSFTGLQGSVTITPSHADYTFDPAYEDVTGAMTGIAFVGTLVDPPDPTDPDDPTDPRTLYVGAGKQYATIQAAVDAAQSGDTIIVSPGTYRENVLIEGKRVSLLSEDYSDDEGLPLAVRTVIEGVDHRAEDVVSVLGPETKETGILGFTIRGGHRGIFVESWQQDPTEVTIGYNHITDNDLAIVVSNGRFTINDNVIYENGEYLVVGAIELWGTADIEAIIQGNQIRNNAGIGILAHPFSGALYNDYFVVVMAENIISNNGGVGISASVGNGSQVEIDGNTIEGNKQGIRMFARDGKLWVTDNDIIGNGDINETREDNFHTGNYGGGILLSTGDQTPQVLRSVEIRDNRLINNTAGVAGGGLYVADGNGDVQVTNNVFTGNRAGAQGGGGIYVDGATSLNGPNSVIVDANDLPITLAPGADTDSGDNVYTNNLPDDLRLNL